MHSTSSSGPHEPEPLDPVVCGHGTVPDSAGSEVHAAHVSDCCQQHCSPEWFCKILIVALLVDFCKVVNCFTAQVSWLKYEAPALFLLVALRNSSSNDFNDYISQKIMISTIKSPEQTGRV